MMPAPILLSRRFIDAYNRRDRNAMRALLSADLDYVRPGGGRLQTADEVMDQYERDWAVLDTSAVEVRKIAEFEGGVFAEITVRAVAGGRPADVDAAIVHEWRDGLLVRYRLYADLCSKRLRGYSLVPRATDPSSSATAHKTRASGLKRLGGWERSQTHHHERLVWNRVSAEASPDH